MPVVLSRSSHLRGLGCRSNAPRSSQNDGSRRHTPAQRHSRWQRSGYVRLGSRLPVRGQHGRARQVEVDPGTPGADRGELDRPGQVRRGEYEHGVIVVRTRQCRFDCNGASPILGQVGRISLLGRNDPCRGPTLRRAINLQIDRNTDGRREVGIRSRLDIWCSSASALAGPGTAAAHHEADTHHDDRIAEAADVLGYVHRTRMPDVAVSSAPPLSSITRTAAFPATYPAS